LFGFQKHTYGEGGTVTNRKLSAFAFLALAGVLAVVGIWRAYVRIAGRPADYALVALLGSAAEDVPPAKRDEVRDRIVDRGRMVEGALATCCLLAAAALAVAGYRRLATPIPGSSGDAGPGGLPRAAN
jgi:hypothetical protein